MPGDPIMIRVLQAGLSFDHVELHVAAALPRAGVELFAINTPGTRANDWCTEHGIPFVTHEFRNRFDRDAIRLYRQLHAAHSFDIIHALSNRALSTALWATRHLPTPPKIIGYRGTMGHLHPLDPASRLSYLSPRVDRIICVSHAVQTYLQGLRIPAARLTVIWKGHDPAWYTPAPRAALTACGIPPDATVVAFVGNIRPVKGVNVLLEAFRDIPPTAPYHLLLFGEVRDRSIRRQIGRHPHIHFLGYRPDAPALAGACDIAVMPSIEREGLPKAILESMAQGVPPIVTNVGGLPELVEHNRSGLVVPPRDAPALRDALLDLLHNPDRRRAMGQAARDRITGPFHIRHTAEKTIALYHSLLSPTT